MFTKGNRYGVTGRPKGIVDKRHALRALIEPHAPDLVAKAIEMAKGGDANMMRVLLDKVIPTPKVTDAPVDLGAPLVGSTAEKGEVVLRAVSQGLITPDQADSVMRSVHAQSRILEVDQLERRLAVLEAQANARTIDASPPAPARGRQRALSDGRDK